MQQNIYCVWIASSVMLSCLAASDSLKAQILPDATLPVNSTVRNQGNIRVIEGGTSAGSHLFHSFEEFSIPTGASAFFNQALNIQNIFSRITGSSISNIDGLIRANGAANLFLLNPNGIILGPNARLNIGGSFFASTANNVRFADGTEFSTVNPQAVPLLAIAVPIGLQYGSNTGTIVAQGSSNNLSTTPETGLIVGDTQPVQLQVPSHRTLALIGGNLSMAAAYLDINGEGGRIELGSVGDNSFVSLTPLAQGFALGYQGVENFQDINISQQSTVIGGDIQLQGRRLIMTEGSNIRAIASGSQPPDIAVNTTESVELNQQSSLLAGNFGFGSADAGNITIQTKRFIVRGGSGVTSQVGIEGNVGNITINASEFLELSGDSPGGQSLTRLGAGTFGTGNAGNVTIHTGRLVIRDGAIIQANTVGGGDAGNVTIKATESVELSGTTTLSSDGQSFPVPSSVSASTIGSGKAGNVTVETGRLIVRDGAMVLVSTGLMAEVPVVNATPQTGNAGNINIRASEFIELTGNNPDGQFPTLVSASTLGGGNAGNITLETGQFTIRNHAEVSVNAEGTGNPGNINVIADNIRLDQVGRLTATSKTGRGGNIQLEAQNIQLRRQAEISAASAPGTAEGNVGINAQTLVLLEASQIRTSAEAPNGGSNIRISPLGGSDVSVFQSPDSIISASGSVTVEGEVQPDSPNIPPVEVVDTTALIDQSCDSSKKESNFIVTGRGGLPPSPSEPLSPEAFIEDLRLPTSEENLPISATPTPQTRPTSNPSSQVPTQIVEAQGWTINAKGQVVLTTSTSNGMPQSPGLAPATCLVR